jgi:hypothetical protein
VVSANHDRNDAGQKGLLVRNGVVSVSQGTRTLATNAAQQVIRRHGDPNSGRGASASGAKETSQDTLSADIKAFLEVTLRDEAEVSEPRVDVVQQNATQVETQFNQQMAGRGWANESTAAGLLGKVKVMLFNKGKVKATVMTRSQGSAETMVYIVQTQKR